ncbi:MAG: hypothetical protein M3447_00440 [Acidobacteriota bacterium]|nr:hypothetical protein [Acidobacteriota bacterium]
MKTLWLALAGCCIAIAAVLMVLGHFDGAFVVAVVGMVAWFLNYRAQVTASLEADDATTEEKIETERNED